MGKRPRPQRSWFQPRPTIQRRRRVGGGISADPRLRLGQAGGVGKVELQRAHAEPHDVAVRVDQAGDQGAAAAVEQVTGALRPPVAALEQLLDPPVLADPDRAEPEQPPVLAQRVAVDVLDQDVGQGRGGDEQQERRERGPRRRPGSRLFPYKGALPYKETSMRLYFQPSSLRMSDDVS